ncbi:MULTISPECIES: hypothetical protein [unclassified Nostoc]|nr:hypothetical protein [Nostoc sp. 'Peltigera membranacea cyanobiont' N6]
MILKRVERLWEMRCVGAARRRHRVPAMSQWRSQIAKAQFGKLAKTYSSNVVSVVKPVKAASLQYASLLRIRVANLL